MRHGIRIFDNGGATFDRYRVQFDLPDMDDGELLVGPTGNVANGVCMWVEDRYPQREHETEVDPLDVPRPVRRAIVNELRIQRRYRDEWERKEVAAS